MKEITSYGNKMLYPLVLPVRYEILGESAGSGSGCGRTIGVGSRILVFSTDRILEVNRKIRFTLDWPVSLPDGVALRLWAFGTIIGVDSNIVSVAFSRAEFRTRGTGSGGAESEHPEDEDA